MKKLSLIFTFFILLTAGFSGLWADIATEGEVAVKVQLMNGSKFPSFEFYIEYQSYKYDRGYQPDGVSEVILTADKVTETGQRGHKSFLFARDKSGRKYVSKKEIGGVVIDKAADVAYYLDQIEVLSLRKGEVKFKTVRKRMNAQGLEILKGDSAMTNWLVMLLPIACLAGLVSFFLLRRKAAGQSHIA